MRAFLIPAIDLKNGQCVRLKQGKMNDSTVYSKNPVEMALHWQSLGASRIHIVDLDGAFAGKPKNLDIIEHICKQVSVPIQVGGGVRSKSIVKHYFDAGVSQVIVGTKAIQEPDWFKRLVDSYQNKIILGLDAYGNKLATEGWQDTSEVDLFEFAKSFDSSHLFAIVYTDISRDGMLSGINWDNTQALANEAKTPIIASGGFSSLNDASELKKRHIQSSHNLIAAIVGKSLYEKKINLKEATALLK